MDGYYDARTCVRLAGWRGSTPYDNRRIFMKQEQLEAIRSGIQEKIAEMEKTIRALEERAQPVSLDQPIGRISRMDSLANQAIADRMLAESRIRLLKLKSALARMHDRDFGVCAECGNDIPVARLLAMPESILCVQCAE
jgi:DnaK suppressor protein